MTNDNDRKNKRILLVDDEPDVTSSLEVILEGNGFIVDSSTDPTLALANFKRRLYDLLLLDIKMPKINGFELYQKMKKIDNNVKVCFLTASELFYEKYRRIEGYPTVGKEKFIQKPFGSKELIRQLNEILHSN